MYELENSLKAFHAGLKKKMGRYMSHLLPEKIRKTLLRLSTAAVQGSYKFTFSCFLGTFLPDIFSVQLCQITECVVVIASGHTNASSPGFGMIP
jgi:hypothetical protein